MHTIVSSPNPKLWQMVHTSDLIVIIRYGRRIIKTNLREMTKLNTHNPIYCIAPFLWTNGWISIEYCLKTFFWLKGNAISSLNSLSIFLHTELIGIQPQSQSYFRFTSLILIRRWNMKEINIYNHVSWGSANCAYPIQSLLMFWQRQRRETVKFWDLVRLMIWVLAYIASRYICESQGNRWTYHSSSIYRDVVLKKLSLLCVCIYVRMVCPTNFTRGRMDTWY